MWIDKDGIKPMIQDIGAHCWVNHKKAKPHSASARSAKMRSKGEAN
jgi:hypothetical protein